MQRRALLGLLAGGLAGCSTSTEPSSSPGDTPTSTGASDTIRPPQSTTPAGTGDRDEPTRIHDHRPCLEDRDAAPHPFPMRLELAGTDDEALREATGLSVEASVVDETITTEGTAAVDISFEGYGDAIDRILLFDCPTPRTIDLERECADGTALLGTAEPELVDGCWRYPDPPGPDPPGPPCHEEMVRAGTPRRFWLLGVGPGAECGGIGVYRTVESTVRYVPPDGPADEEREVSWTLYLGVGPAADGE